LEGSFSRSINEFSQNVCVILEDIEKALNHPLANKFYKIAERYNTPYLLLDDIISKNPQELIADISDPNIFKINWFLKLILCV